MTVLDKIEAGEPVEAQELFDYITSKVLEQGRPSLETNYEKGVTRQVCVYRGQDGAKCAAGHVIPGAWYSEKLEGRAADGVLEGEPRLEASLAPHLSLLLDLQGAHDSAYQASVLHSKRPTFMEGFIRRAIHIAEEYNLNHAFEV
jgi:hypothetical protein